MDFVEEFEPRLRPPLPAHALAGRSGDMLMTPEPTSDLRMNGRNGNNNHGHVTGHGNESGR